MCDRNFRLSHVRWEDNTHHFAAWCEGQQVSIVDAAIASCGDWWMHNRSRMIVASFLAKDLLIDWRWGERFFMQHLIDAIGANNGAGSGLPARNGCRSYFASLIRYRRV